MDIRKASLIWDCDYGVENEDWYLRVQLEDESEEDISPPGDHPPHNMDDEDARVFIVEALAWSGHEIDDEMLEAAVKARG